MVMHSRRWRLSWALLHIASYKLMAQLKRGKKVKSLSHVRLFAAPWTVAYWAPPSMGFSRQEYWSGMPFPSPEDLSDSGIEPGSPTLQADTLSSEPPGKLTKERDNQLLEQNIESCQECTQSAKDSSVDRWCYVNCPVEKIIQNRWEEPVSSGACGSGKRVFLVEGYVKRLAGKFTS